MSTFMLKIFIIITSYLTPRKKTQKLKMSIK